MCRARLQAAMVHVLVLPGKDVVEDACTCWDACVPHVVVACVASQDGVVEEVVLHMWGCIKDMAQ